MELKNFEKTSQNKVVSLQQHVQPLDGGMQATQAATGNGSVVTGFWPVHIFSLKRGSDKASMFPSDFVITYFITCTDVFFSFLLMFFASL